MTARGEPPRLLDLLGEGDPLHEALQAGRSDLPGTAQLESLWDRLVSPPPGPGGDGSPPGSDGGGPAPEGPPLDPAGPATGALAGGGAAGGAAKLAAAVLLTGALAIGSMHGGAVPTPPLAAGWSEAACQVQAPPALALPPTTAQAPAAAASEQAAAVETPHAPASGPASGPSASPRPSDSEVGLLMKARAALASSPAQALHLVAEAQRLYPRGRLGPEREVIRIQALAGAGRRQEAIDLARALIAGNPDSAYARRLASLFPEIAAP